MPGSPTGVKWPYAAGFISALALIAVLPALLGDWVYDDRILPSHPLLDGLDDVLATFVRTSESYLSLVRTNADPMATGVTYRPLPLLTLALVNAVLGAEPLWHHLFGAAIHVASVCVLAKLFAVQGRLGARGWFVVSAFALHPCLVEAYGWINGRSDTMAGLALLALALTQRHLRPGLLRWALSAVWLVVGALCKETFLVASAALLVALQLSPATADRAPPTARSSQRLARAAAAVLCWLLAVGTMFFARAAASGGKLAGAPAVDAAQALGAMPRLAVLLVETLLVPLPRGMRLLSWELSRPWSLAASGLLLLLGLACAWLLSQRRYSALVLLLGAFATLAPAVLIGRGFWFGFDRYLYMPACLLALSACPSEAQADTQAEARTPQRARLLIAGWVVLALVLVSTTRQAAFAYASHRQFLHAMMTLRPDDPSGYLFAAQEQLSLGNRRGARGFLLAMPVQSLPLSHAHRAVTGLLAVGELERAGELAERSLRELGPHPRLLIGLGSVRAQQGRYKDAVAHFSGALDHMPPQSAALLTTLEQRAQSLRPSTGLSRELAAALDAVIARAHAMRSEAQPPQARR